MTLYLHIGTPKTGTTSIQNLLHHNRDTLLHQGYLYPGLGADVSSHSFLWEQETAAERCLELLRRELSDSGARHVIISAESLQHLWSSRAGAASVRSWTVSLGCTDVRIIVYLREQASWMCSFLSQDLRSGRCGWRRAQLPHPQDNPRRLQMDHRHTLECWGEAFGHENLCVRVFAADAFAQGDLLCDFMQAAELPAPGELTLPQELERNESLNLLAMRLLGGVSDVLEDQGINPQTALQERGYLQTLLERHIMPLSSDPALRYTPPRELCEEYEEYYAASNAWVRRTYFPTREQLFRPRDYTSWQVHTSPEQLQPQVWQALAQLLADAVQHRARQAAYIRALLLKGGHS